MESVKWFCSLCLPLLGQFDRIALAQAKIDDKMTTLETLMLRLEKKDDEISKRMQNLENLIEEKVDERLAERMDQESRKLNVIIYGLQESKKEDTAARKEDDMQDFAALADLLDVNLVVTSCTRLGKRDEKKTTHKRPLKLVLAEMREKSALLRSSKKLREVTGRYEKVFINPDLTPAQREKDKKLVDELKAK